MLVLKTPTSVATNLMVKTSLFPGSTFAGTLSTSKAGSVEVMAEIFNVVNWLFSMVKSLSRSRPTGVLPTSILLL